MSTSAMAEAIAPVSIETFKDGLPSFAKDIKLNLGAVLSPEGAPDLSQAQIHGIALAVAYATRQPSLIDAISVHVADSLAEAEIHAAKAAATIMAMNNVYYRFLHLVGDPEFKSMPAKLRMNVIGSPGIAKADFELYALAVSAINGCGMCMESHVHELHKAGVSKLGIQSAIRIASVINAAAQAAHIQQHDGD